MYDCDLVPKPAESSKYLCVCLHITDYIFFSIHTHLPYFKLYGMYGTINSLEELTPNISLRKELP